MQNLAVANTTEPWAAPGICS